MTVAGAALLATAASSFGSTISFVGPSGLSAEATFSLASSGSVLQISLRNTSTGAPADFDSSDLLLTSIAFNLGGPQIVATGSTVEVGSASEALFDSGIYGAGTDVSGEYGIGNNSGVLTGFAGMTNHVSTLTSGTTQLSGANLDGPADLSGPQGGLLAATHYNMQGGLGVIGDEIFISLNLSSPLGDLSFLDNGAVVEFGSDAAFLTVIPAPSAATVALFGLGACAIRRRR